MPMGSLGADKLSVSRYTDAQKLDNKRVAKGWKIQSLNNAVDSILASATRLEKEIEKETKYWEQILAVSDAGWSLCRLPNEKHTLGVRFGFAECRFLPHILATRTNWDSCTCIQEPKSRSPTSKPRWFNIS